jgi:arylsulfatase A-like enzyme
MNQMTLTRRNFVGTLAAGAGTLALSQLLAAQSPSDRPNILWIVSEDNNPFLGCYGYKLARTPTLDRLATNGILYENCFSQAPVCAPSRFTLISGMYATSCGPAHHMRAQGKCPKDMRGFPAYLRDAGYYCTNNAKTDYNAPINMKDTWDESSNKAHWRNRPQGKPFFAVFNHEITHESQQFPQARNNQPPLDQKTDPAKVQLPPYHPDTPEFRADWANYFDQMARLDRQVAKLLQQLNDDGLAENTIVFYYGDNGGTLPRSKRFPYDSGLHVPLIVRFPKKWQHLAPAQPGSRMESPVSFVDFAPTVLNLAGAAIPQYLQGHAFLGPKPQPQEYAFSFRGRMDERYDMVRTVRDQRYRYLRNYMPHLIWGQHVSYMFQQKSMQVWEQLHKEGKLTGPQKTFWQEKPDEELYDIQTDPHEVKNLATSPDHQDILKRLRAANIQHILRTRDNGFIPEGSPLEGFDATRDPKAYPLERIVQVADTATRRDAANLGKLVEWMGDENECIRYWAVLGCVMLREKAATATQALSRRLNDDSGSVRVAAAEALCHIGQVQTGLPVLEECLSKHKNPWVRLQAANALTNLGQNARPVLAAIAQATADDNDYVKRATRYTAAVLKGEPPRDE